jgi:hypothetical protein
MLPSKTHHKRLSDNAKQKRGPSGKMRAEARIIKSSKQLRRTDRVKLRKRWL